MNVDAAVRDGVVPVERAELTIVGNRLPFSLERTDDRLVRRPSTGGVASALDAMLRRQGGTWIGWPGLVDEPGVRLPDLSSSGYRVVPVALTQAEVDDYYDGFANQMLWPLLHSMPERARFRERERQTYRDVNRRFATAAATRSRDRSPLWIHDYHLMETPAMVREVHRERPIAFYMHVPFPSRDVLRRCPWHADLVRGLLGADLVGFHVPRYATNFLECVEDLPDTNVDRATGSVVHAGRTTRVGAFPIGADFRRFEAWARAAGPAAGRERIVLSVDRLDYTKGIPERLDVIERLYEAHPEHRARVTFVQISVPARTHLPAYRQLRERTEERVAAINRRLETDAWRPVDYRFEQMSQECLAALYRQADVALVTPLCDGMNLVAKEYVASQVDGDGVLVLTRSAGAADAMAEALLVDADDVDGSVEAVHRALLMDPGERARRMEALRRREAAHDVHAWADDFLHALRATAEAAP